MIWEKVFLDYFLFFKLVFLTAGLGLILLKWLGKISDAKLAKTSLWLFVLALSFLIFRVGFFYWSQYLSWRGTYFLPPFQPLSYFLSYSWLHFAKPLVFDLGLSVFFFFLIAFGTKISQGRFFHEEEKYTGGLAILLNSWPVNLFVFFLVFFLGILSFLIMRLVFRNQFRESLINFRYLWILTGLILLWGGSFLIKFAGLDILAI